MRKVLIVDDEPLARIGMQSMIDAIDGVEVQGTASDGQEAFALIKECPPDIIITDIKMPIMDGLQLLEKVYHEISPRPASIVLTSYEEFEYVRTAINYDACHYMMKMELNRENLINALKKACEILDKRDEYQVYRNTLDSYNTFLNRFYFNLLNYTFHSEQDILDMAENYNQNLKAESFLTICVHLDFRKCKEINYVKNYQIYNSIITTLKDGLQTYCRCHFVAWNQNTIGIILMLTHDSLDTNELYNILHHLSDLAKQYFGCSLTFVIGKRTDNLLSLSDSFSAALSVIPAETKSSDQCIYSYQPSRQTTNVMDDKEISIQQLTRDCIQAFENCDVDLFSATIKLLRSSIFAVNHYRFFAYISSMIHVIINCLDDGEDVLSETFHDLPLSYQTVYSYTTAEDMEQYLNRLEKSVIEKMSLQTGNSKNKLVLVAQNYIKEHIYDKLTLNAVAAHIGVSPNYLSTLFRHYSPLGFSDYVINLKVQKAKEILSTENRKIYEVSNLLGFDNPNYFSKVYKKFTGFSPTETPFIG